MSNPVLNNEAAEKFIASSDNLEVMSISGTVLKTLLLLTILFTSSAYTFMMAAGGFVDKAMLFGTVGLVGGFITAMIIIFSKNLKWTAPLSIVYSVLEGFILGAVSAFYAVQYGGTLVANAIFATFITLFVMLFLYSSKIIKCTEKFMGVVIAATFAILVIYLVSILIHFFNPQLSSFLLGSGPVGIGFSVFVCVVAALNFIIDFHVIENAKNMNVTKDFEWYGAFSLMVTIIWLYLEILKLLAKLNSRR